MKENRGLRRISEPYTTHMEATLVAELRPVLTTPPPPTVTIYEFSYHYPRPSLYCITEPNVI
jgi:hypothetical protein